MSNKQLMQQRVEEFQTELENLGYNSLIFVMQDVEEEDNVNHGSFAICLKSHHLLFFFRLIENFNTILPSELQMCFYTALVSAAKQIGMPDHDQN